MARTSSRFSLLTKRSQHGRGHTQHTQHAQRKCRRGRLRWRESMPCHRRAQSEAVRPTQRPSAQASLRDGHSPCVSIRLQAAQVADVLPSACAVGHASGLPSPEERTSSAHCSPAPPRVSHCTCDTRTQHKHRVPARGSSQPTGREPLSRRRNSCGRVYKSVPSRRRRIVDRT